MEDEVRDVVAEVCFLILFRSVPASVRRSFANSGALLQANAYVPNWGQTIFQSANEMLNNALFRERLQSYQNKLAEEREWWDKKKASIQEGFMKELDAESSAATKSEQATSTTTTTSSTPGTKTPESSAAPSTAAPSDDEAVLVEAADTAAGGSSSASKKKKKGKK
jgi:translocation protein SEC66